ncbi:hypothetical protein [Halorarius litoreus]|uniref:hypothetical protein n=1 Tax=Halorarius litoreus TaxID=2962676 RepID=UPI0020CB9E68|nr:hypothetical protein [Halorarius litoreus]
MDGRTILFGTERGAVLAIALALLAAAIGWTLSLPVEPPFPSFSLGYWAVVLLYTLPAILVGAYGGGLVWTWIAEGVPFAVVWWPFTTAGTAGGDTLYRGLSGRLGTTMQVGLLAGVMLGTAGFVLGRGLRLAWERQVASTPG